MEIKEVLRTRFKLSEFRQGQEEVIENILMGQNVLSVMPTGYGKSLCYQLPAFLREGLTVVISPLVALMKDQVDNLVERGLTEVTFINSSVMLPEQRNRLQAVKDGCFKLVYIAPERFRSRAFLNILKSADVKLLVVDEAHCISQWGHDFRPDYLVLKDVIHSLNCPQVAAFTATATPEVRQDIKEQLGIADGLEFLQSITRESLEFFVFPVDGNADKLLWLKHLILKIGGKGIVYAGRRRICEQMNDFLQSVGINSEYFHAKRTEQEKRTIQERFMDDAHGRALDVIIATNAFGLGIDKANIRFVIHSAIPGTVEEYFQEAGRAGRDGKRAFCVLLYTYDDRSLQQYFIENSLVNIEELRMIHSSLLTFPQIGEYRMVDPHTLEWQLRLDDTKIHVGISHLERLGFITRLPDIELQVRIRAQKANSKSAQVNLRNSEDETESQIARAILNHTQTGSWLNIAQFCSENSFDPASVIEEIDDLEFDGVISLERGASAMLFKILDNHIQWQDLSPEMLGLELYRKSRYNKLDKMLGYAESQGCRVRYIREYFDEKVAKDCGRCDNCRAHERDKPVKKPAPRIDADTPATPGYFDEERLQRAFLMTVRDTHEHAGKHLIVDVLKGSKSKKVYYCSFQKLRSYGKLAYFRREPLLRALITLILKGLVDEKLKPDFDYPVITLTTAGAALLAKMEEEQTEIDWPPEPFQINESDKVIFRALKDWRLQKARQMHVPAFCILSNKTLVEIAVMQPSSFLELSFIRNMADKRLNSYGPELVDVLQHHISHYKHLTSRFSKDDRKAVEDFLDGKASQKLVGPFDAGYALAPHSRIFMGEGKYTPIGLKLFEYKYRGIKSHVHDLAKEMVSLIQKEETLCQADIILPVPGTLSGREFDPVMCLAEEVGKQSGLVIGRNILVKTRKTQPQKDMVNLTQKERNVQGAFRIIQPQVVAGKRILVVDDLYDSGATCRECTRILKNAGCAAVYVLTVTRTIHSI